MTALFTDKCSLMLPTRRQNLTVSGSTGWGLSRPPIAEKTLLYEKWSINIIYTPQYSVNTPLSLFCRCFDCCTSNCVFFASSAASLWIWSIVFGLLSCRRGTQFIFLKSWTSWSMKRTLDEVFLTSMILPICWKYWSTRGYENRTDQLDCSDVWRHHHFANFWTFKFKFKPHHVIYSCTQLL